MKSERDLEAKLMNGTITTIGELVELLTTAALETAKNEDEAYLLTSLAMEEILNRQET